MKKTNYASLKIIADSPAGNRVRVFLNGQDVSGQIYAVQLSMNAEGVNQAILTFVLDELDIETQALVEAHFGELPVPDDGIIETTNLTSTSHTYAVADGIKKCKVCWVTNAPNRTTCHKCNGILE